MNRRSRLCWVCILCLVIFLEHTNKKLSQHIIRKRFLSVQFLQKLNKVRISSLVNKRFGVARAGLQTTCLFTRLESLAWSQQGFWQPSFFRKRNLWIFCCDWRTKVGFLCIACRENTKIGDKSSLILPSFSTHSLSSRKAMQRITTLFPP